MRSFNLCESPPGADHMTTKLWQAHMSTHAHWGALIPKTTLARTYISIKHRSEYLHKYIDSVFFAAALHLCCHLAYCPSTLALQACTAWLNICSQVQQEHPLSVWHSLPTEMQAPDTRLVAQAGCHKWGSREAKRGVFFFFPLDSNYTCSFTEVLDLMSFGSQRWLSSYLKGFFITVTDEMHVPFCRVSVSAPTPAAVRIFSVTTFASPPS